MAAAYVKQVGAASAGTSPGSALNMTVASGGVPIGNTVLTAMATGGASGATLTVTDARSNVHGSVASRDHAGFSLWGYLDRADVSTALLAGDTITATLSAATGNRNVVAHEFSGLGALHGSPVTAEGNSTTPSVSITTTTASKFLVGVITAINTAGSNTALTAPWSEASDGSAITRVLVFGYRAAPTAGTYTLSGTLAESGAWTAIIAAFDETGGGAVYEDLSVSLDAATGLSAGLSSGRGLSVSLDAASSLSAGLSSRRGLSVSLDAAADLSAGLSSGRGLSAALGATSDLPAAVSAFRGLAADLSATSDLVAQASAVRGLAGTLSAVAALTGALEGAADTPAPAVVASVYLRDEPRARVAASDQPRTRLTLSDGPRAVLTTSDLAGR